MKIENGITNFAVYEDATEYHGMAEVTLPEISTITEELKGAGINGTLNSPYAGHIEAMSLSLNFRTVTKEVLKLAEPRNHQIDLRASQQQFDAVAGMFKQTAIKHVLIVMPTKFNPGKLAIAASAESTAEFSVSYFATFIDGVKVLEIDILNFIYFINGVDYLADVKKALGK